MFGYGDKNLQMTQKNPLLINYIIFTNISVLQGTKSCYKTHFYETLKLFWLTGFNYFTGSRYRGIDTPLRCRWKLMSSNNFSRPTSFLNIILQTICHARNFTLFIICYTFSSLNTSLAVKSMKSDLRLVWNNYSPMSKLTWVPLSNCAWNMFFPASKSLLHIFCK